MASHMRAQRVSACMRLTLPATIDPFAGVLLLPDPNMFIMDMLDEVIHIS